MKYIFFTDVRSSKITEAQKTFLRERSVSFDEATKKSFLRERSVSFDEATKKVVPKGAQCKFSAQKSFQRECRAKYHRNIRQRSPKDISKGMQNLHQKVTGDIAEIEGEEVQKTFLRGCRTYTEK
jgi:hypothetical protein